MQAPAGSIHWRNVAWFGAVHILGILGIVYLWYWWSAPLLIEAVVTNTIRVTAIAWGYHRYYSHQSYRCARWLQGYYLIGGAMAMQNAVVWWVPNHIDHHADTDGPRDPHSIRKGFFWAHMGWLLVHAPAPAESSAEVARLRKDPLVRWQERHILALQVVFGVALPTLASVAWGDPIGGFLCNMTSLAVAYHMTWWVNSGAHTFGSNRFDQRATARTSFSSIVLSGVSEGYGHDRHHRYPWDYRNDARWYGWDPGKWAIFSLSLVGATWKLCRVDAGASRRTAAPAL